jgi:alpha/beta superfamily hydrolase
MIANSIDPPTSIPSAKLLVSLPLGVMWALATTKCSYFKSKAPETTKLLSIYGDRDQFTRSSTFQTWDPVRTICISGADHFWMGFEGELIDHIEHWRTSLTK